MLTAEETFNIIYIYEHENPTKKSKVPKTMSKGSRSNHGCKERGKIGGKKEGRKREEAEAEAAAAEEEEEAPQTHLNSPTARFSVRVSAARYANV